MTDPLAISIQTAGVDTSYPIMPEADYKLQLVESNYKPSNFDPDCLCWAPKFVTTEPIQAVDGRTISPNTQVYVQYDIELQERKDSKYPGQYIKTLCSVVDAFLGTDNNSRPNTDKALLDSFIGKIVLGHVIIDTDKQGVHRNKVKFLKKGGA